MYRLKVRRGKKWVLGVNVYDTILVAQTRQVELELVGIQSMIVDRIGSKI